jgi:hypothetical protein
VSSTKEQPVALERVRVTTLRDWSAVAHHKSAAAMRPSALRCQGASAAGPLNLTVKWCRFEGVFLEAVYFDCPIDATLELNRFFAPKPEERPEKGQIVNAVSVRVPPAGAVKVSLVSNTMGRFTHFLRVDKLPEADSGSGFVLRDNLALGNPTDAWVWVNTQPRADTAQPYFAGSGGNVCRPRTMTKGLGDAVVPRKLIAFDNIEVSTASDQFLRYKKSGDTAQLLTAGTDGGPVGVPPL